jgi:tetratricopeptide (TPR) repeat protein
MNSVSLVLFLLFAATPTFEESFRAGLLALQRNDLPAAEENLATAAKLQPGNARVWIALARTWSKQNQPAKADDAAVKAETLGAKDPIVLSSLATFYADSGRKLKAAEAQAKYSALVPDDAAAREQAEALYFAAAEPLLQQKRFTEAMAILTGATARLPNSAQLELALGVAAYGLRRFDEAAAAFLRTIAIAPEVERPYVFLGRFLGQIPDRLPEVTRQFIRFEKANPASPTGYLLHAKALNAQSVEAETAVTLLEKSIELDGRDASAHFELGVALERTGRHAEALRAFLQAAGLAPKDSATHYRLSRLYDRLGQRESARRERQIHAKLVAEEEEARQ